MKYLINMLDKCNLLGVGITISSEDDILEYITTRLKDKKGKWYVVTPNPEMIVLAARDKTFKDILNGACIALPDGVGVVWGARLLGKGVKRRITGTDLVEKVCEKGAKEGLLLGFLGGRSGVADRAIDCLREKYPLLKAGFIGEQWDDEEAKSLMMQYDVDRIDMLFVAFGFPKQEKWICENLEKIPVKAAMGVGGAFDFISVDIPRAPRFVRNLGLEWLFRLIIQPWRWKRQLALLEFTGLVLKEAVGTKFGFIYKCNSVEFDTDRTHKKQ